MLIPPPPCAEKAYEVATAHDAAGMETSAHPAKKAESHSWAS